MRPGPHLQRSRSKSAKSRLILTNPNNSTNNPKCLEVLGLETVSQFENRRFESEVAPWLPELSPRTAHRTRGGPHPKCKHCAAGWPKCSLAQGSNAGRGAFEQTPEGGTPKTSHHHEGIFQKRHSGGGPPIERSPQTAQTSGSTMTDNPPYCCVRTDKMKMKRSDMAVVGPTFAGDPSGGP